MDLLASLGLGNALPEQSSRLTSHPGIIQALESSGDTDDGIQLGFNACLHCGSNLFNNNSSSRDGKVDSNSKAVSCKGCKRVKYCSASCRKADATPEDDTTTASRYEDEPAAIGHSPVICALLNLCNDDEDAEEEFIQLQNYNSSNNSNSKNKNKKSSNNNNTNKSSSSNAKQDAKKEAATYRIQTEFESYPATLFNILSEGPNWYIESITRRLRSNGMEVRSPEPPPRKKQRRGKRDKSSLSPCKQEVDDEEGGKGGKSGRELILHIVGASVDSELWHWQGNHRTTKISLAEEDAPPVVNAYAEAASNLASHIQNLLEIPALSIRCIFIGPDCPKKNSSNEVNVSIPDLKGCTLVMETHCCNYGDSEMKQKQLGAPDAIVFFNPGFSCPDYDWSKALASASSSTSSSSSSIPFLITTNTEMEGFADIKCLLDGGYITSTSVPRDILEAVDHSSSTANSNQQEEEDGCTFFFGENPYSGMRVRQSGTMGNDLYVKNRWIVGGLFQQQKKKQKEGTTTLSSLLSLPGSKKKRKAKDTSDEDNEDNSERKKKQKKSGNGESKKNTKRKNPALI